MPADSCAILYTCAASWVVVPAPSKTVTAPRVRANKSLRLSAVNSPLPDARRSAKPVLAGIWPLLALSLSSVVRKFRGKLFSSSGSTSQINTGESASAGGVGGVLCTSVAEKLTACASTKTNRRRTRPDKTKTSFTIIEYQIARGFLSMRKKFP